METTGSLPLLNLCKFVSKIRLEEMDPSLISRCRFILVDTLGAIVAGSLQEAIQRLLAELPRDVEGNVKASCLGRPERTSRLTASMVNGIAGSSLEFEEGNSWAYGHPAIQMVPALVADCEGRRAPGRELLAGLIAGYESASRVSRASSLRKGLHPTGTWGTVGAALGVGRLRQRSPEELYQIANLSASFAISPYVKNSFAGRNVASTFAGISNYFGLLANLFFDCGIRAEEASFRMTFSRFVSDRFDEERLDEELGENYYIMANYFKPYPSCRSTHAPIDALKSAIRDRAFLPEEVEEIRVETYQAATHCDALILPTPEAIRFSIPYLFAVLILYGDLTPKTIEKVPLSNPRLKSLAEKVEVKALPQYENLRPLHTPARVAIRLRGGQELTREVMHALGDPLFPLEEEALFGKFISLAGSVIGRDRAERFWDESRRLENVEDVAPLIRLLCPVE